MKCAVYCRYSSEMQRDGESIEAQLRATREFCDQRGWEVVESYVDEARSGTSTDREAFQQMRKDAHAGKFNVVVSHKLDRMFRNVEDYERTKKELERVGVFLVFCNLPTTGHRATAAEEYIQGIFAYTAAYYSRNLGEEVMKGQKEKAYKAQHTGGTPPLGYDVVGDDYAINESEADTVRWIFSMYSESSLTMREIAEKLNSDGIHTKRGARFSVVSVYEILSNEKYIGRYIWNMYSYSTSGSRSGKRLNPESDWIVKENGVPRIIDDETWRMVKVRKADNRRSSGQTRSKEVYILSGVAYCGECGTAMTGATFSHHGKRYGYYICPTAKKGNCKAKSIRKETLEKSVIDTIRHILSQPELDATYDKVMASYDRFVTNKGLRERELARLRTTLDKDINVLVDIVTAGNGSDAIFAKLKALEKRKADAITEQNQLRHVFAYPSPTRDEYYAAVELVKQGLDDPNYAAKAIKTTTAKVSVFADRISIGFNLGGKKDGLVAEEVDKPIFNYDLSLHEPKPVRIVRRVSRVKGFIDRRRVRAVSPRKECRGS